MKKLLAYMACGLPLLFGGMAAASAQTEIGSGTGVDITYTGSTLTLTGSPGAYSTHNGSAVGTTYGNTIETFTSTGTGTNTFVSTGGSPTGGGQTFGGGSFTITDATSGAVLLSGTFTGSTLSEGTLGGTNEGDFLMSGVTYSGTQFPAGFSADNPLNQGSLTYNYTPDVSGGYTTSDASAYYAVKSASSVPELSPVAILAIGSLGLLGMLFAQGRSRRTSRVAL